MINNMFITLVVTGILIVIAAGLSALFGISMTNAILVIILYRQVALV